MSNETKAPQPPAEAQAVPPSAPVGVEDSFTAADMADAAAQGFRDGAASVGAVEVESEARAERLAEALRLIASPKRPDGTWNRDREACRQIAENALRDHDQEGGDA